MELWAPWSSRCPCSWQGGWNQMIFKVPSNPNHSMILWKWENQTSKNYWGRGGHGVKAQWLKGSSSSSCKEPGAGRAPSQLSPVCCTGVKATRTDSGVQLSKPVGGTGKWTVSRGWSSRSLPRRGADAKNKPCGIKWKDLPSLVSGPWQCPSQCLCMMACSDVPYLRYGHTVNSHNDLIFFLSVPFVWFPAIRVSVLSLPELSWNFQRPTIIPQFLPWWWSLA